MEHQRRKWNTRQGTRVQGKEILEIALEMCMLTWLTNDVVNRTKSRDDVHLVKGVCYRNTQML